MSETKSKYVVNTLKVAQIQKSALSHSIIKALEGREAFKDEDKSLNETIYNGDVFDAIIEEIEAGVENEIDVEMLMELSAEVSDFEYIMVTFY